MDAAGFAGEADAPGRSTVRDAPPRIRRVLVALVVLGLAAALWLLTPLSEWVDAERIAEAVDALRGSPLGLAGVVAAFWIAAAVGVPVTLQIAAIGAAFGAVTSVAISTLGVAGSASLGFAAGRLLPRDVAKRRLGGRLESVADRVLERGVLAVAIVRNVPIAPYAIVNVACGATPLSAGRFLAGTILGMLPGIVLAGVFGQEVGSWLAEPTLAGTLRIAAVVAAMIGAATLADRALRARGSDEHD